jgi:hypothetical protein
MASIGEDDTTKYAMLVTDEEGGVLLAFLRKALVATSIEDPQFDGVVDSYVRLREMLKAAPRHIPKKARAPNGQAALA